MELSRLAQGSKGSAIREMYNEAMKMEDTISFTVGEPDFVTPKPVIDAACENWQKGLTHYTPNSGEKELLEAIADYHKNDLKPDPESQIIVTCGATESLQLALFTLVNPGDEVIVITPAWPNYFGQVAMCGARLVCVRAYEENGFIPRAEDIERAITDKTKLILLNSPSNPTGAVIDKDTCGQIADLLRDKDIYIITDEVYSRFVYTDEPYASITSYPWLKDKIVYVNGFSKMFAMTGWRLGYSISTPDIIKNMTKLHENGVSCLPKPSQLAAAEAMLHCQGEVERMKESYLRRRELICSLADQIPGFSYKMPKGAFYLFINIKAAGMSSKDFCMDLLKHTGIVTVPGSGFGEAGEGYIRMSYATSDENIIEGMRRIKEYMEKRRQ